MENENDIFGQGHDSEEPVNLEWLRGQDLSKLSDEAVISVLDDNFPECTIWREGNKLCIQIQEHIYTKYWWHKFHGSVFAAALVRAIKRLQNEGYPLRDPELDSQDDDVHIFVRWVLELPTNSNAGGVIKAIESSFDLIWRRANSILEDSDSVLILGKDTGESAALLKTIEALLQDKGYHTYIIREQPDRLGESIIQKVLRYALSSKFVVIENSEPSGHLYEIPQIAKLAECVTVVLQEKDKGATWMLEDAYFKHHNMRRFAYSPRALEQTITEAATWAEDFYKKFADFQTETLPWLKNVSKGLGD